MWRGDTQESIQGFTRDFLTQLYIRLRLFDCGSVWM